MAYLFKLKTRCSEDGCRFPARYVVRSDLLLSHADQYERPEPRCLRHAKKLEAWFEAEEARLGVESY